VRIPRVPHSWSLTPRAAIALQKKLARRVCVAKPPGDLRFIAGLDAAFSADGKQCLAAVVLWDSQEQSVVEQHTAARRLAFPYVPGLLSFREAPVLLAALRKLQRTPDALMCDGQGFAHPRRLGLASHVGILCGLPTIGCAKSRLCGEHVEPERKRGSLSPLMDDDEQIGEVLRTQDGVKPVYVSVGHLCDLPTARELVLACVTRYRLPEPTRLADRLVAAAKRLKRKGL
jgi:deoxyribonuclease V